MSMLTPLKMIYEAAKSEVKRLFGIVRAYVLVGMGSAKHVSPLRRRWWIGSIISTGTLPGPSVRALTPSLPTRN